SSQSIAAMWAPQINFPGISYEMGGDGADFQYGLGWMISEVEGRTLIHHGGSRGTMSSMTILIPEKKLAASILINLDDNYIDRYRFQSAFSILNNLFHLIENEKLTDFGRPRIPDPTLNDYQLPQALGEQIIGTYRFSGKGDTRNLQGAELTIFRNQNGALEARINRGETVLNHFEMDFTNKVHAVSRNIGSPIPISIKAKPDGTVTTIYFGNSEFIKLQPDFLAKYQQQHIFRFSFYFPKNWSWIFHDKHFEVRQENDPDVVMQGGINTAPSPSLKYFIRQHDPDFSPFYEGVEKTEVRGSQFWRQQSFASRKGAKIYQQMVLLNETEGFYLILATPSGKLTNEVQASLSFLMDTFTASQSLP
ncbi:MAG: hypothetical protein KDD15_30920, partial [Lewinella sp.]|nr:hypothetical protein [Lewinella sp.]